MWCAEMTEPSVSQGTPTAESDDVVNWRTQEKKASNAIEGGPRTTLDGLG